MTAKKVLLLTISAAAVFAAFFGIKTILAAPTCGTGGVCSVLTTDGSGNFGIGANSDTVSRLIIESADTSTTKNGLRIVSSDGSTPVFVVRNDGLVTLASSTSFANAGLVFPDGSKQVMAFTGAASSISAGNVSAGSFGSNLGGGIYSFPAALAVGTTTVAGLPASGLFVLGSASIGPSGGDVRLNVNGGVIVSAPSGGEGFLGNARTFGSSEFGMYNNGDGIIALYNYEGGEYVYANGFLVSDASSLGIGTSIPQYQVDIYGSSNKLGLTYSYTANYGSTGAELSSDNNGNLHIIATKRFPSTLAKDILLAENGGKVGIATTTPTYPLTVAGVIHSSTGGYRFPDGTTQTTAATAGANYFTLSGSNLYPTSTTYNLGVGTTTPASKITAVGDIRAVGSLIALSSGNGLSVRDINGSPRVDTNLNSGNGELSIYNSGANKTVYLSSNGNSYLTGGTLNVGTATPTTGYRISTLDGGIYVGSNDQGGHPAAFFNSNNSGVAVYVSALNSDGGYLGAGGMVSSAEFGLFGSNDEVIALFDSIGQKFHYGSSAIVTEYGTGGRVGIGTVSPAYLLDVDNGSNITYPLSLKSAGKFVRIGALNSSFAHVDTDAASGFYFYDQIYSGAGNNLLNLSSGNSYLASAGGNVGIATTTPGYPLTVAGTIYSSSGGFRFPDGTTQTTAAAGGVSLSGTNTWTGTNYFRSTTFSTSTILTSNQWDLQAFAVDGGAAAMSFHRSGAYAVNMGLNPDNSFAIGGWSDGAANRISIAANGNTTFGSGTAKINVGTVDPPYTINGEQYATYMSAMTGQKEETTGELTLICHSGLDPESSTLCGKTIDFNTQEKGSDLWLFAKTTNLAKQMDKMTVLLTPSFDGKVWYEKDIKNNMLKVFAIPATSYTLQDTSFSVSYRLTAPRFDADKWTNTRNEKDVSGLIINY